MRLDAAFHLSFYVTLAAACACLIQADSFFLPWLVYAIPLVGLALVLAWRYDGEWELGETAANYLGLAVALGGVGWMVLQLPRNDDDLINSVAWPAGLLPHLGPFILVLLLIKLFRPKRVADFWVVQTIGLMTVTLGCVLAGEAAFGVLLAGYLVALLWCLALFHLGREQRLRHGADESRSPLFAAGGGEVPWSFLGAGRVASWAAFVFPAGLLLFLVTPRNRDAHWVPQRLTTAASRGAAATGVEPGMDLNRVGTVELSNEVAFRATVANGAGEARRLPSDQRWRVEVLDTYRKGRWRMQAQHYLPDAEVPRVPARRREVEPVEGPGDRLRVRFSVLPAQAGGLALAEPVDLARIGFDESIGEQRAEDYALFYELPGCDAVMPFMPKRKEIYAYAQIVEPRDERSASPAPRVSQAYRAYLLGQSAPAPIGEWTRTLLGSVSGLRPAERRLDEQDRVPIEHQAQVARRLTKHLAHSDEFTYTLTQRRRDADLDPAADFLLNVKSGHCERYAAALALMLRSLGIPSRVIKGYRGAEAEGDGNYVVRQNSAHAWVQALVQEDGEWRWLTLDPTPGTEAAESSITSLVGWVGTLDGPKLWKQFVLDYDSGKSAQSVGTAWRRLADSPSLPTLLWGGAGLLVAASLLAALWRLRGRLAWLSPRSPEARDRQTALDLYNQMTKLLAARLGLSYAAGQTPLEFAEMAAGPLRSDARTLRVADVPLALAGALYRVRFGGQSLDDQARAALHEQLLALQAALPRSPAKSIS